MDRNLDLEKESDDAALNRVRSAYKFLLQLRLLFARLHLSKRKFLVSPLPLEVALWKRTMTLLLSRTRARL